ncbi:Pyridine nucleotide-disulfide oxidoreductase domain-containing protein 1 [Hypsibius exemplaris]|uniref:Pyridine nucleotide-disulfide oxidoreductase domain-containing protein 1 n=1 Tax=Hypsibius exemplaris TaxID=2072580 RepID=A0A9X6RKZ6_HYPEX|nr:Pyridine nucleotide-disulfide oxidoreductase domain-containing protein 1 [Hypsibius exemplaris]
MADSDESNFECVVIGGGICGVSCIETISILSPLCKTLLISGSPLVKVATGVRQLTKTLEEFDVEERAFDWVESRNANIRVVSGQVTTVDSEKHVVHLADGRIFSYKMLCVCSGGKPKVIAENNPFVLAIRDTETVQEFVRKLADAKRIAIIGNGGIATEMVWELEGVDAVWVIKDSSISAAFVDAGAAEFFLDSWKNRKDKHPATCVQLKRIKYTNNDAAKITPFGSALGPDWATGLLMKGKSDHSSDFPIQLELNCEVKRILTPKEYAAVFGTPTESWPVYVELTNGKHFGCDFIVSATGVTPNVDFLQKTLPAGAFAVDGGVTVDDCMESMVKDIFVAGDACTAGWPFSPHWFQMRLWTQARQMGAYAAKCMLAKLNQEPITMDFTFELFAHATKFFGFKVILLSLFNGQRLGSDYEVLLRMTKGVEFIKLILKDGAVQGAVLIGETDLEETFENLILNGTDVSAYGEDLLNPDIDIDDYFD